MNVATTRPRLISFVPAGDDSTLDQVEHHVGHHLGVNAQIVLVAQGTRHR